MATAVIMPRQGQSVESCVITSWAKNQGDKVAVGDLLFSYETDKSAFDEKSEVEGVLLAILREEGEDVPCLEPVCVIGQLGEDISSYISGKPVEGEIKPTEASPVAEVSSPAAAMSATPVSDGRLKISPRARLLAEQTKADLSAAIPTGPNGRIIERDVNVLLDKGLRLGTAVDAPVAQPVAAAPIAQSVVTSAGYTDVKLSGVRKSIAKAMHASLSSMAQLTLNSSFDATKLQSYRAAVKAAGAAMGMGNITLNDMVLFAVAKVLPSHPDCNAHYLDDVIRRFDSVNLGIAVDTERGLLVPTLFAAEKLSLNELSKQAKALAAAAQSGTVSPDTLRGGTFTVTNLGALGIESFTPVINPPQTCILGVNNITIRTKEVNGQYINYPAMGLSLTFDHRAIDGAPAARLLAAICSALENFDLLLAK